MAISYPNNRDEIYSFSVISPTIATKCVGNSTSSAAAEICMISLSTSVNPDDQTSMSHKLCTKIKGKHNQKSMHKWVIFHSICPP